MERRRHLGRTEIVTPEVEFTHGAESDGFLPMLLGHHVDPDEFAQGGCLPGLCIEGGSNGKQHNQAGEAGKYFEHKEHSSLPSSLSFSKNVMAHDFDFV